MLSKQILLKAIKERESGEMPNFSNIVLNQAVDLYLFEGYTIEKILSMSEDDIDFASNPEDFQSEIISSYKCPECGGIMIENFVDCESDGGCDIVYCTCKKCGKEHKFYDYGDIE